MNDSLNLSWWLMSVCQPGYSELPLQGTGVPQRPCGKAVVWQLFSDFLFWHEYVARHEAMSEGFMAQHTQSRQ
jgi:hypothetical protein